MLGKGLLRVVPREDSLVSSQESQKMLWKGLVRIVPREDQFPILALLLLRVVAPLPSEERTHSFC